jgi:hypothetical protein
MTPIIEDENLQKKLTNIPSSILDKKLLKPDPLVEKMAHVHPVLSN